jgi:hypothetical protein
MNVYEFDGRKYRWTGVVWFDIETQTVPPEGICAKLTAIRLRRSTLSSAGNRPGDLLQEAKQARDRKELRLAETLVRRVLAVDPDNLPALAVLCSVLRSLNRPEDALRETVHWGAAFYVPLITSRAAALCDLEHWDAAERELWKVFSQGKGDEESFMVLHRIRAAKKDMKSDEWEDATLGRDQSHGGHDSVKDYRQPAREKPEDPELPAAEAFRRDLRARRYAINNLPHLLRARLEELEREEESQRDDGKTTKRPIDNLPSVQASLQRDPLTRVFKICSNCHQILRLTAFYKSKKRSDGRTKWCKECLLSFPK